MPDPIVVAYDPGLVSALDEQHYRIRQVVFALQETDDLGVAAACLRQLEVLLRSHFEAEERVGGMLDCMTASAAAQDRVVASIIDEHRAIVVAVEAALADANAALEGSRPASLLQARVLCGVLLEHQRREGDAFLDAIYGEPGGEAR